MILVLGEPYFWLGDAGKKIFPYLINYELEKKLVVKMSPYVVILTMLQLPVRVTDIVLGLLGTYRNIPKRFGQSWFNFTKSMLNVLRGFRDFFSMSM